MRVNDDDFRSNIGQGGKALKCEASPEQIKEIKRVVKAIGGGLVSVDFLINDDGKLLFCEANANAGVGAYEQFGYAISDEIIDYLIRQMP